MSQKSLGSMTREEALQHFGLKKFTEGMVKRNLGGQFSKIAGSAVDKAEQAKLKAEKLKKEAEEKAKEALDAAKKAGSEAKDKVEDFDNPFTTAKDTRTSREKLTDHMNKRLDPKTASKDVDTNVLKAGKAFLAETFKTTTIDRSTDYSKLEPFTPHFSVGRNRPGNTVPRRFDRPAPAETGGKTINRTVNTPSQHNFPTFSYDITTKDFPRDPSLKANTVKTHYNGNSGKIIDNGKKWLGSVFSTKTTTKAPNPFSGSGSNKDGQYDFVRNRFGQLVPNPKKARN